MGRENIIIGKAGEDIALRVLVESGYKILDRNVRTPFGEIDIVAKKGCFTIIVEVKSRYTYSLGPPYLSVTNLKTRHIIKNALYYMKKRGFLDTSWRIDVVSVELDPAYKLKKVEIFENAVTEEP